MLPMRVAAAMPTIACMVVAAFMAVPMVAFMVVVMPVAVVMAMVVIKTMVMSTVMPVVVPAPMDVGVRRFGPDKDGYRLSAHVRHSTPWGYYRVKYSILEIPMKIGELAKAAGTTVETVRYYEKEGLLPAPERGVNNYRSYGPLHAERLRLIRNCRALDMTQDEIRAILTLADSQGADCGPINEIFEDHMRHVDERIAELTQLKAQLSALRQRCASARPHAEDCGILHGLAEMQVEQRPERHTHLG
jgi:Cd(II)/Pb(II)-responsive transcriptional regulator